MMPTLAAIAASTVDTTPYIQRSAYLALALGLGLFVGMERERHAKQAGIRTFGFVALVGGISGQLGTPFAVTGFAIVGGMALVLNADELVRSRHLELTTSAALLVVFLAGVLCGQEHAVTPTAIVLVTAGLLAVKEELVGFTLGLTDAETRSAILLAILAFVVYPVLPSGTVGPGNLLDARLAWVTVVLTAAIGFANYVMLKQFGSRGLSLMGFFGGLVNSTVTAADLAGRTREAEAIAGAAYRGIMWSEAAMAVRNTVLVGVLAAPALRTAAAPLAAIAVTAGTAALFRRERVAVAERKLTLRSPFSVTAALQLGAIFLALQAGGDLAERHFGHAGFLVVSTLGGLVSSTSAVASASALASRHALTPGLAGLGVAAASLASVLVDLPVIARAGGPARFRRDVVVTLALVTLAGLAATLVVGVTIGPG